MTDNEIKYMQISSMHDLYWKKTRDRLQKIMIAKGVTTEMMSDLLKYEKSNKKTEKSKMQLDRLFLLEEALDVFSNCACEADQLNVYMRFKDVEISRLNEKNKELTEIIKSLTEEIQVTKEFYGAG